MKTTRYFDEQVSRKRPYLLPEWFEDFRSRAVMRSVQDDGRIRYWVKIALAGEVRTRWLRIVCLDDEKRYIMPFSTAISRSKRHEAALLRRD